MRFCAQMARMSHQVPNTVMNTNSQSGKENVNTLPALMAEKFGAMGEYPRKALEYLALFIVLSFCYSFYLKGTYDKASCPAGPVVVTIDLGLLLPILKF